MGPLRAMVVARSSSFPKASAGGGIPGFDRSSGSARPSGHCGPRAANRIIPKCDLPSCWFSHGPVRRAAQVPGPCQHADSSCE